MLALLKVAVTGGLACGKSTVCQFLREMGAYVVDADAIVHQLLSSDTASSSSLGKQVVGLLGSSIIVGNRIDRKKIAAIVFSDPNKLKELEKILHPAVLQEIKNRYNSVKENSAYTLFAAEVPLLYEANMEPYFDYVIAVSAAPAAAQSRSRLDQKQFDARMERQDSVASKASKADAIITNNGSLQDLKAQVARIIHQLKEPKRR